MLLGKWVLKEKGLIFLWIQRLHSDSCLCSDKLKTIMGNGVQIRKR